MITIKGNGNIITKEFQVSSFVRLHLSVNGLIELIQSADEKVVLETDENLLDYFEIQNAGRTLYVSAEAKSLIPEFTSCTIKVYLRQIDVLYIRCEAGNVICPNTISVTKPLDIKIQSIGNSNLHFEAPFIKLLNQSVGDVIIKGKCGLIEIKNQGNGKLDTKELIASDLKIKNMSTGDTELFADNNISISHYGEGNVFYYGNAILSDVKQNGQGLIQHKKNDTHETTSR